MAGAPKQLWAVIARVFKALTWSLFLRQKFTFFIAKLKKDDLAALSELMNTGKVSPVIDRRLSTGRHRRRHRLRGTRTCPRKGSCNLRMTATGSFIQAYWRSILLVAKLRAEYTNIRVADKLLDAAENARERALVQMLYGTGARARGSIERGLTTLAFRPNTPARRRSR